MNFPGKKIMPRFFVVTVIMGLVGLTIIGRALYIILVDYDYWMAVSDRFVKTGRPIEPTRGNILSADGQILAASIPEYRMFMDFMSWEQNEKRREKDQKKRDSLLNHYIDSVSIGMHRIFPDIDPAEFKQHLKRGREKKSHYWPIYNKRVSYIQYREAKKLPFFNLSPGRGGGFHATEYKKRKNPYGKLAIRTIGDLYGEKDSARCGLELAFDSVLRGKPGVSRRQKVLNRFLSFVEKPAEDGCDLVTTLDVGMQDFCEKTLRDQLSHIKANSGVCILMEVATGDIKAITSLTRVADGSYHEIQANAVSNLYEPGSVFKPMSFLVALDDGVITLNDQVDTGHGIVMMNGRQMKDHNWGRGGYGVLTVPEIIGCSSNIGVSTLIEKHYKDHPEKFVDGIHRLGVAEDLKLPIPGYPKPRIRRPKADGSNWSKTALPWMSIGYETQIPPISTLTFYNGIANNGVLLRPRFVTAIQRNGEVVKEFPVEVLRQQMAKPQAIKDIKTCLREVTQGKRGVGKKINSKMFNIAGKTGTAQIWTKSGFASSYLVSFVGYFPEEKPLYSCIVCIQKDGFASGGIHCGPVFKRVAETIMAQQYKLDYITARDTVNIMQPNVCSGNLTAASSVLKHLGVEFNADFDTDEATTVWGKSQTADGKIALSEGYEEDNGLMPDVRNYGLRDAVFLLEKQGLKVKIKGVGRVKRQSIAPGKEVRSGMSVLLELETPKRLKKPKAVAPNPVPAQTPTAPNSPTTTEQKKNP